VDERMARTCMSLDDWSNPAAALRGWAAFD
jgi:hypothetical protein